MPFSLRRPSDERVRRFLDREKELPFTYGDIGATRGDPPSGFVFDQIQANLGRGADVFERAKEAIRAWAMFPPQIAQVAPAATPIEEGRVVALRIRSWGLWALCSCRIVYTIDESRRFGFAYGTLPGHLAMGEERFLVEWRADDSVVYDLCAFSRPRHWLARLGYPMVRRGQSAFRGASAAAMRRAVQTTE